jgi:hypothetical protein
MLRVRKLLHKGAFIRPVGALSTWAHRINQGSDSAAPGAVAYRFSDFSDSGRRWIDQWLHSGRAAINIGSPRASQGVVTRVMLAAINATEVIK